MDTLDLNLCRHLFKCWPWSQQLLPWSPHSCLPAAGSPPRVYPLTSHVQAARDSPTWRRPEPQVSLRRDRLLGLRFFGEPTMRNSQWLSRQNSLESVVKAAWMAVKEGGTSALLLRPLFDSSSRSVFNLSAPAERVNMTRWKRKNTLPLPLLFTSF